MAYIVSASIALIILFACCGAFFDLVVSQDNDDLSGDQHTTAHLHQRYYNNRRQPAYPVSTIDDRLIQWRRHQPKTSDPSSSFELQFPTSTVCCPTNKQQTHYGNWNFTPLETSTTETVTGLVIGSNYASKVDALTASVLCVSPPEKMIAIIGYYYRGNNLYTTVAQSCNNNDCICVVGDPYETISSYIDN